MGQADEKDKAKKEEWIPIYRKRLGEAINHAKGKQSMAEFARKCGLNPMTLSRAVNGTIKKPLDEETIRKMAECSEAPTEEVLEYLMRSNGWVKNDDEERKQRYDKHRQKRQELFDSAQGMIMRTLFEDGYTIIPVFNTPLEQHDPTRKKSRFHLYTDIRFALSVKGYEPAYWNFSVNIFNAKEIAAADLQYADELKMELRMIIDRYKDVFLRDVWEPEAFKNTRYSIVFLDKGLFDGFFKELKGLRFNSSFSLILLDLDKYTVVEERLLPRYDGRKEESLFRSTDSGKR